MEALKTRGTKSIGSSILIAGIIFGYLIFFSSRFWMPDNSELVEATQLYESNTIDSYNIYLTEWVYSESDAAMEIIVENSTNDLLADRLTYEAVERNSGELHMSVVNGMSEYAVLRIEDIPDNWQEISLRIQEEGSTNTLRLYTNCEEVERVSSLPEKSQADYQIDRLEAQIGYDDFQITQLEEEVTALASENRNLTNRISELETAIYPTQEEADNAKELADRAREQIAANAETIEIRQGEISEIEERTEQIREQISKQNIE